MYRDPTRFPQHARLAAVQAEAQAAMAFARWLEENRLHIRDADGHASYTVGDADRLVLRWLGVDLEAFLQEARDIATETAQEEADLVRAAAAAPLVPPPDGG